jgi:ABC-type dipeptide/oligopeptide/nickel transport system permease subunit
MAMRGDRTVRAFLTAIRASPAFGMRVAATLAFAVSLVLTKGFATAIFALVLGAVLGLVIGYPLFRRRGRVP